MSLHKFIEIGKLLKERGLKGEMKLLAFTDDLEQFKKYTHFFIKGEKRQVEYFKNSGRFLAVKIKGIDDASHAMECRSLPVMIDRESLPKGDVLIQDYLGLKVLDETKKEIGVISTYLEDGKSGFFKIVLNSGDTKLIPSSLDFFSLPDFKTGRVYLS